MRHIIYRIKMKWTITLLQITGSTAAGYYESFNNSGLGLPAQRQEPEARTSRSHSWSASPRITLL